MPDARPISTDVLVFALAARRYAVDVAVVREVVRAVSILPLPGAPPIVEGLIDLRGTLVPVLDVRARFGLPPKPIEHTDLFVVAESQRRLVALHVDDVDGVLRLDPASVDVLTPAEVGASLVAGVARTVEGLLVVHDLDAFLSLAEQRALMVALASAAPPGATS